jgi:transposase
MLGFGVLRILTASTSLIRARRHTMPLPMSGYQTREKALDFRILNLIATIIEFCAPSRAGGRGHPPAEIVRVVATLRQFLREGTPWRSLRATASKVSGSTLRRHLERWARIGLLPQIHAVLIGMLRGNPTLILDSCSARAKRGGDLTGPNPTDRAKSGTKYHIAVDGDGVPVACVATAANVNDTVVFERLFLAAFAVMARIETVFADKGYDAEHHRDLCRQFGVEPRIHKRGQPHGSGLGARRWPVERSNAWVLENKRLALRYDRRGFIVQSLLQAACIFLVAGRLAQQL